MPNLNLKKNTQMLAIEKEQRRLREAARAEGIPEFMLRFARERHLKIFPEQFVPRYRHD